MSSSAQSSILSPIMEALATELVPYCNRADFSLHRKLVEIAYRQVVQDGDVKFHGQAAAIKRSIIDSVANSSSPTGKELADIGNGADFIWPLYEKCVAICERENLNIIRYKKLAIKPKTVTDALSWLNMTELKAVLREKGQPVSGKRADLDARMVEHINISDLQKLLDAKFQDKIINTQAQAIATKYDELFHFVRHRAYFLQQIGKQMDSGFYPELKFIDNEDQERLLATLLDGTGFDTVIIDDKLCKLMPLFPSSLAAISFRYRRRNQRASHRAPPKSKFRGIIDFFKGE